MSRLLNFAPNHTFRIGETRHFKFRLLIDTQKYSYMHNTLFPKGMCSESRDHFRFWELSDNISLSVQDRHVVAMKPNRKSYVAYPMSPLPMPLNNLEGQFCLLKPFPSAVAELFVT